MLSSWTCITPVKNQVRFPSNKVEVVLLQKLLSSYVYDLITNWGHFKDHRRVFVLARGDKQRTIPSCIKFSLNKLKKASIRLQNNKFPFKKHKAEGSYTGWRWRSEFSVRNSLPKDLKSKISVSSFAPKPSSKPWFNIELFLTTSVCKGLHSSKLNSANWIIRKYRKLHIRVCFARFSQIQLQKLFTGKESIVFKSLPAVVVLSYFTQKPLYREKTVYIKTHKTAINRPVDHTGEM